MPLRLRCHTLDIVHHVNYYEVERIIKKYNIQEIWKNGKLEIHPTYIAGINRIVISKNPICKNGVNTGKYSYKLLLTVNMGKVLGTSSFLMTEIKKATVRNLIDKLSRLFHKELMLDMRNSDAGKWKLRRLDCGLDLYVGSDSEQILRTYMKLVNRGIIPGNSLNAKILEYPGYDDPLNRSESIKMIHSAKKTKYAYNIYAKAIEAAKREGLTYDQMPDEVRGIIRIEKQLETSGLDWLKKHNKSLEGLLDEDLTFGYMRTIVEDMEKVFGTGDHVRFSVGWHVIGNSNLPENEIERLRTFYYIYNYGYQMIMDVAMEKSGLDRKTVVKWVKYNIKMIEKLGISAIALTEDEAAALNTARIESLPVLLRKEYESSNNRKSKSIFGRKSRDKANERWLYKFSLHKPNGMRFRTSVSVSDKQAKGRDADAMIERKVLDRICKNLKENLECNNGDEAAKMVCVENAINELFKFRTVSKDADVLKDIDMYLSRFRQAINIEKQPVLRRKSL